MSSRAFASEQVQGDAPFLRFASRRSPVHSRKGMVACSQPLAARAGIRILHDGGNAADAAVATAAALNMAEPGSTGIGGDCFCLFYDATTKKTHALNGSGRSGSNCTLDAIRQDLGVKDGEDGRIPFLSVQAVTVPGAPAGWVDTLEKFGNKKLSLAKILEPAIELGEEGFAISELSAIAWKNGEHALRNASPNFREMLKPDPDAKDGCRPPREGEIFHNENLANTFRLLAEHGKKGFYEGPVAEALVKVSKDLGGRLELSDLKQAGETGAEEVAPISIKFSGQNLAEPIELWEHPPNGQGLIALLAVGIFQELERAGKIRTFKAEDHNSAEYLHALVECLRLAFSDGTRYIADPNVSPVPIKQLLEPAYLKKRGEQFESDKAMPHILAGNPSLASSDTVYLSVTDQWGNACSFINSNYAGFGSAIIPKGCGFTLQNRGAGFYLQPADHPNILAPNKRPFHTIIPAMITNAKDGSLNTCFGVMGGYMQPQGHMQVLMNMFVFGMNPQIALDSPRICIESTDPRGESKAGEDEVYVEEGISKEAVDGLRKKGHNVFVIEGFERFMFGRGQVIKRTEQDGKLLWSAGSDFRGDGQASPL